MIPIERMPYKDMVKLLNEFEAWIKARKVKIGDRFPKIKSSVEELSIEYEKEKDGKESNIFSLGPDLENCMYEAVPFIKVYQYLKNETGKEFKHLLKTTLNGPNNAIDETNEDNEPRNNLFHLNLASSIVAKGINIKSYKDIVFDFNGYEISIQCKRPRVLERLGHNVGEANRQFYTENLFNKKDNARGIIAISVEKMLGLESIITEYDDESLIAVDIHNMWQSIVDNYRKTWSHFLDKHVLAIIFYFRYMAIVKTNTGKMFTTISPSTITPLINAGNLALAKDYKLIRDLHEVLK